MNVGIFIISVTKSMKGVNKNELWLTQVEHAMYVALCHFIWRKASLFFGTFCKTKEWKNNNTAVPVGILAMKPRIFQRNLVKCTQEIPVKYFLSFQHGQRTP